MLLKNATCFLEDGSFQKVNLLIENGLIASVGQLPTSDSEVVDLEHFTVIPGLVDVHTHGCVGYDFSDADAVGFQKMSDYYAKNGITSVLATTISLPDDKLIETFTALGRFMRSEDNTVVRGIHMEGPFLSHPKRGAHDGRYVKTPDATLVDQLQQCCDHHIKLLSAAPELDGMADFISHYKDQFTISLAHTEADYSAAIKAFAMGADHVTHLYNAMSPFNHREPGLIGATFDNDRIYAELICDGIHLHEAVIRASYRQLGEKRTVLVSDSMSACGIGEGVYELGGQTVQVKDGKATLASGVIAGSAANLFSCMKKAIEFGIPTETALRSATLNPARSVRLDHQIGSLSKGKRADLVVLDKEFNIQTVFVGGKVIR